MAFLNDRDWLLAHVRYSKDDGGKTTEMMECFQVSYLIDFLSEFIRIIRPFLLCEVGALYQG